MSRTTFKFFILSYDKFGLQNKYHEEQLIELF